MWERFPPRMRKTITTALELAGRAGAAEASTEHLLLAATEDSQSAAAFLLEHNGIALQQIITDLRPAPLPPETSHANRAAQLDASAYRLLEQACKEADALGDRHVGTEHIALSLASINGTPAAALLKRAGFTHERGVKALAEWHRLGMPRQRRGQPQRFSVIRRLTPPILRKAIAIPRVAWQIFAKKSLGHPAFVKNPYPMYDKLRATEPVRRDPFAPVWVLTSYADAKVMMQDATRFKKDPFAFERLPQAAREQLGVSPASAGRSSLEMVSMLFLDPPEHTRIRSIFTKAFTPRRLESLRARIQVIADRLLDEAEARAGATGVIDLVRDLAAPLPVTVIAELLGFPPGDFAKIKHWSDELTESLALNATQAVQARAYEARHELREYFEGIVGQITSRQTESGGPPDSLLAALISGEAYGDRGERLNPDELFSNSVLLLAAGHETTTGLISLGMLTLLQHPDQLKDLREHTDELIASCVDEMLRFDTPVQWSSRVTGEDVTLSGVKIERGQILLASIGAANRDPAVFPNPHTFDIRRKDNRHLSFGSGCHYCLGAALTKMEVEIAVATLIRRYPKLALADKKINWRKGLTFRGPLRLTLRLR